MTLDQAVALSLLDNRLPKPGLTARLLADDPELLEHASVLLDTARTVRLRAESGGMHALPWNDARFPTLLGAISDVPPIVWCRGQLAVLEAPAVAIVGSRAATPV